MRIAAAGILNRGVVGTERAIATFPAVTALLNRRLIASYRIGSTKDSADETVELRFSQDLGETWTEPIRPFSTTVECVSGSLRVVYITELDDRWPPPDCGSTAHPIPANRFSIPLISLRRECEHAGVSFGRASSPSERHPPVLRT